MLRVFANVLPDVPYVPLLYPNLGVQERESILFLNGAFAGMDRPFVELTDNPEDCDCVLLAHNWPSLRKHQSFVRDQSRIAVQAGKPLIVFWHGDGDGPVNLPGALVFRTSLYRYNRRSNETAMPAYAEDLLAGAAPVFREKSGDAPVIGFCGWARYKNLKNRIGTAVQNALIGLGAAIESPQVLARRKGLSFRREAIGVLRASSAVTCNFVLRSSYSGHSKTIGMDAAKARDEYRANMRDCDLALCVKGDGNYSYRFYEALSMGRVPLLIDTQCVLPLADRIDYDSFVLRADFRNLQDLPSLIAAWWSRLTPEEFRAMQERARRAYEEHLSVQSFFCEMTVSLEQHQF